MDNLTIPTLKAAFQQYSLRQSPATHSKTHRPAAVLILIYPGENELELILTRRSRHLPHHAGQISLPGGSVDAGDASHIHTALREAEEEIGLDSQMVSILGTLDTTLLPSGFIVTPVVGVMPAPQKLQAEPGEVDEIFSIPLSLVLNETLYQQDSMLRDGIKREFYFFDFNEYYVWGATANILRSLSIELAGSL